MRNHLAQLVKRGSVGLARGRWLLTATCGLYVLALVLSLKLGKPLFTSTASIVPVLNQLWPLVVFHGMCLSLSVVLMLWAWRECKYEEKH